MTKETRNPKQNPQAEKSSSLELRHSFDIGHSSFVIYFREWSVAIALLALLLILAVLAPGFFQKNQLLSICSTAVPVLLVACGISLVIISRQIDISVGSQFAMCSVLLGLLVQAHWPVLFAGLAA